MPDTTDNSPTLKKAGQPTKYGGDKTVDGVNAITGAMKVEQFFSFCSVDHIAEAFGVCRDTIYEWRAQHSAFDAAMKRWETKRNALFHHLAALKKDVAPAVWIFLAKNWLGMTDRQDLMHSGQIDNKLIVEVVHTDDGQHAPQLAGKVAEVEIVEEAETGDADKDTQALPAPSDK